MIGHAYVHANELVSLPRTRIERIAAETTGITADTALRLGKALGAPWSWPASNSSTRTAAVPGVRLRKPAKEKSQK